MKVLAWVPQVPDTSPGQRYRIEQWQPHLRKAGIEIKFSPFVSRDLGELLQQPGQVFLKTAKLLGALARRLREACQTGEYDVLYVFREGALLGPALAERIAIRNGMPLVYDFDDAVWIRYVSPANSYLSYLRFPGKTATICRLARKVIVGNERLEEYARRLTHDVSIVPSTIDTDKYLPAVRTKSSLPVIGWTGSYSTAKYLQLVRPALERLRRHIDFKFVVVGPTGFEAQGVEVEHRPWKAESEVEDLSDFDVGIMPLPDEPWERGKCGLKALQYMALAVPPVVSPVGVNMRIVRNGVNGLLANTESEWEASLSHLLRDRAYAGALGRAARSTVETEYSAVVHAPRVASVLQAAATPRP